MGQQNTIVRIGFFWLWNKKKPVANVNKSGGISEDIQEFWWNFLFRGIGQVLNPQEHL
jgi:hypothetical protein